MAERTPVGRDVALAVLITLAIQAATGAWLARWRPDVRRAAPASDALFVEFVARRSVELTPRVSAAERRHAPERVGRASPRTPSGSPVPEPASPPGVPPPASERRAATLALDLRLPDQPAPPAAAEHDPFERPPVLRHEGTRFERAWAPQGNALEQAASRSVLVKGALGLFGGPPKRCNEVERRLRGVNCLPLHGDEEEREALRRGLD